jgi:hypothetical protein
MDKIHIGGEEHEFLSIQILDRESPESELADYWESNWLVCLVEVRAGGFQATVRCNFQAEDIVRLRDRLTDLSEWKENMADFSTLEGWLTAHFVMDEQGRIAVLGDLVDRPMDGNRLRFELAIDQSFLRPILRDLDCAIEAYPVVGSPPQ